MIRPVFGASPSCEATAPMTVSSLPRRRLLQFSAVLPLVAGATGCATAPMRNEEPQLRVLAISDLHSSYGQIAQLLAAFRREVADHSPPHLIVVNGDSFEKGNVVSVRSEGAIDWAFMAELPKIAPTIFNLGNHDNDLVHDLHPVVARMRGLGLTVLSNIIDRRTGQPYADDFALMKVGGQTLRVAALGTPSLNSYPVESREWLTIPDPAEWAQTHLPTYLRGDGLKLVLSHVGVVDERQYLPLLPEGSLMVGGHNHLLFTHQQGATGFVHTGRWGETYAVAEYGADGVVQTRLVEVKADGPADPALAALIGQTLAAHLTDAERAIIGHNPRALTLGETGRAISAGFAREVGADYGFIGLTTLGTGLKAGSIDQFHFDEVVRFDGRLMVAEVEASRLAAILAYCNQDEPTPIERMTGDYPFAAPREEGLVLGSTVKLVTTDWCARNQSKYFGTTDLAFVDVATDGVKAVAKKALLG